jgi:hypothetical protein
MQCEFAPERIGKHAGAFPGKVVASFPQKMRPTQEAQP